MQAKFFKAGIVNMRQFDVLEACSRTALLGSLQPPLHNVEACRRCLARESSRPTAGTSPHRQGAEDGGSGAKGKGERIKMGEAISTKPAYLAEVGLGCQLDGPPFYVDAWEEHDDCTVVGIPVDGVGYLAGARRATLGSMKVHGLC